MEGVLTFRAFAALRGISHQAVSKAVAAGRLAKAVVVVDGTRMIDPEIAAIEWRDNTRTKNVRSKPRVPASSDATPSADLPNIGAVSGSKESLSLTKVQTQHIGFKALLSKLDYDERTGSLVKVDAVRNEIFRLTRTTRDALRAIPPRISGELAGISDQREIETVLMREMDLALESLSKPEFYGRE